MKAQVLGASKQQIARQVSQITGEVREAVFVEDPFDAAGAAGGEDIFPEMEPFTVRVGRNARAHWTSAEEVLY